MTREEFNFMWALLDSECKRRSSTPLTALNAMGVISFASKMQKDLDAFIHEVVSRSKAQFENCRQNENALREKVGDAYDLIEPDFNNELPS